MGLRARSGEGLSTGTWHICCVDLGAVIFNCRDIICWLSSVVGGICFATGFVKNGLSGLAVAFAVSDGILHVQVR